MPHRIGVDLGGTKIEAVLLAPDGAALARERAATPRGLYDESLEAVSALVARLESAAPASERPISVGLGMPGTLSRATGLVKNANSTWLIGKPLDRDLARRLGRPVRIANDADCFALAEATDGAAAGRRNVFGAILGTGVGGGLVIEGRPISGPNGIAGEWGHNPLPWADAQADPALACYCGKRGCIETYLSGPGLAAHHAARAGAEMTPPEIVAAAETGDPAAEASLALYEDRLARALSHVINILDPEAIVLGGGLSNLARLYEAVPRLWGRTVFSDSVLTALLPPMHGDSAGVRGAAWLWSDDEIAAGLVYEPPDRAAAP
ncbi:MAG: ROK family protein [Alphaproteobacteria bacterium]|nr:ROK family protein [Alphaproteobacteria bacterium]